MPAPTLDPAAIAADAEVMRLWRALIVIGAPRPPGRKCEATHAITYAARVSLQFPFPAGGSCDDAFRAMVRAYATCAVYSMVGASETLRAELARELRTLAENLPELLDDALAARAAHGIES